MSVTDSSTYWPGATAQKVEELVTDPIERAVYKIDEVDEVRSKSRTGQSVIFVDLLDEVPGANVVQLWDEVRQKVSEAANKLPEGFDPTGGFKRQ